MGFFRDMRVYIGSLLTAMWQRILDPQTSLSEAFDIARAETIAARLSSLPRDPLMDHLALGRILSRAKARCGGSTKRYGGYLKKHMPGVATFDCYLRPDCAWLAEHEAEVLAAFGWASFKENHRWRRGDTLRSAYNAKMKAKQANADVEPDLCL